MGETLRENYGQRSTQGLQGCCKVIKEFISGFRSIGHRSVPSHTKPINFVEVARLLSEVKKAWLKPTLKEIKI